MHCIRRCFALIKCFAVFPELIMYSRNGKRFLFAEPLSFKAKPRQIFLRQRIGNGNRKCWKMTPWNGRDEGYVGRDVKWRFNDANFQACPFFLAQLSTLVWRCRLPFCPIHYTPQQHQGDTSPNLLDKSHCLLFEGSDRHRALGRLIFDLLLAKMIYLDPSPGQRQGCKYFKCC